MPGGETFAWPMRSNIWTDTTIPGMREIVALHSIRMEIELLRRDPDGNWPTEPFMACPAALLELAGIGFAGPVADLDRTAGIHSSRA